MDAAINLYNAYDLTVGGDNTGEGNVICAIYLAISNIYQDLQQTGLIKILGNNIGTDITGTKKFNDQGSRAGIQLQGYNDGNATEGGTTDVRLELTNNTIGSTVSLFKFRDTVFITGNHFGIGTDNVSNICGQGGALLALYYCNQVVVGGEQANDKNYFTNCDIGINEWYTGNTTITRNSFRCNRNKGIEIESWVNDHGQPYINITSVSATSLSGNSLPNSKVELFYNDDCGTICEGKTYITTIQADNAGKWSYTGTNCTSIIATATDTYGATSEFSQAVLSESGVRVMNSTCGKANGSITNIHVTSGTNWHWEDANGNTISHDLNLLNVPAGKYIFKASIGNTSCVTQSNSYTISDMSLPDDPFVTVTNISCGQSTGSLSLQSSANYHVSWLTSSDSVLSSDFTINNLPPAKYFLELTAANDSTCLKKYGPFIMQSQLKNNLDVTNVKIINAVCGNNGGKIEGIHYSTPISSAIYIEWSKENGTIISTGSLDLAGVYTGTYRLKVKDPANCDTLVTSFYKVNEDGDITTDSSHMQVSGSDKCGHPYGSITGIKITNGETFNWTTEDGAAVGTKADIDHLIPGNYKLTVGNHFGCGAATSLIAVPAIKNPDFSDLIAEKKSGYCGVSDGYIRPTGIQNAPRYNFRWTSVSQPEDTISNTLNLENILEGNFYLNAKDGAGCNEQVGQYSITASTVPTVNEMSKVVKDEICGDHSGSITGLTISGGATPLEEIWKDADQKIISSNGLAENLPAGTYQLYVQDANGCTTSSSPIRIVNKEVNLATPLYKDITIPRNAVATLAVSNFQQGTYSLYNNSSVLTPLQQNTKGTSTTDVISHDKTFYVRLSFGSCSSNITDVHITVADATKVFIPGAFTPNGDGRNDVLKPIVFGLFTLEDFSIYNRYGGLVFKTRELDKGWKGDKNGIALDTGIYIWIIKGKDIYDKPLILKGTTVLIR